ncbi:MAG: FkbM family methyltransferase [Candidatus Binatus sp.]
MDLRYLWHTWSAPFRRRLYPRAVIAADHFRLRIDLRDIAIGSTLFRVRTWEPELLALFRLLDLSGGICIDVGANIGWHTLALSECVGPAGKVFAFEPSPREYRLLLENLRLNNVTNVVAERAALGERKETRWLRINSRNWGDNRIVSEREDGEQYESIAVEVGDDVLAALPAGAIKLIKVDAQGYDQFVVKGLRDSVLRNPDAVLAVEVDASALYEAGSSPTALVAYLVEQGFRGWELHPHRAFPFLAPEDYEVMDADGVVNLVLSRRPEALARAINRMFPGLARTSAPRGGR